MHTRFSWGNFREGDHSNYLGVDGRIILKWIFKKWNGDMDWIDLASDRDIWWALVNVVMNLQVPQNVGNCLTSWWPFNFSWRTLLHGFSQNHMICFVRSSLWMLNDLQYHLNVWCYLVQLLAKEEWNVNSTAANTGLQVTSWNATTQPDGTHKTVFIPSCSQPCIYKSTVLHPLHQHYT